MLREGALGLISVLLIAGCSSVSNIQNSQGDLLGSNMNDMDLNTVMVIQSQAVDEYPLWSEDGNYLAANIAGKWLKINLKDAVIEKTTWRDNQSVGILTSEVTEATLKEIDAFKANTTFKPREYVTKKGYALQLRLNNFSTEFVTSSQNGKPTIHWVTGSENCHSLSSNKAEKYIAFICESNGVFIYRVGAE